MAIIEASIEGPMGKPSLTGTVVTVPAMGMTIRFTPGKTPTNRVKAICTPTRSFEPLTLAEFASAASLPGRTQSGFDGATIIAEGTYDTVAKVLDADFIDVEPSETVLIGALTRVSPTAASPLAINGVDVFMLTDARLPANRKNKNGAPVFYNQYSFPMKISSAIPSDVVGATDVPSSVEGYYGDHPTDPGKKAFHAFLFEYGDTGTLADDPVVTPQISIERSPQFRDEGALWNVRARGTLSALHPNASPLNQQLMLFVVNDQGAALPVPGGLDVELDDLNDGFVRWRLRTELAKTGVLVDPPRALLIRNITAEQMTGKMVSDTYEIDIREA